ncbi:hypothetical protein BDV98DRAFT_572838, partial [Pterulicium gracile]
MLSSFLLGSFFEYHVASLSVTFVLSLLSCFPSCSLFNDVYATFSLLQTCLLFLVTYYALLCQILPL